MTAVETNTFVDTPLLFHRQKEVLDSLRKGDVSDIRVSHSFAADKIVAFGLDEGFLHVPLALAHDDMESGRYGGRL